MVEMEERIKKHRIETINSRKPRGLSLMLMEGMQGFWKVQKSSKAKELKAEGRSSSAVIPTKKQSGAKMRGSSS